MAERTYNPFTGFSNGNVHGQRAAHSKNADGVAAKVKPVDWSSKTLVPGKWKVIDANALRQAASQSAHSSKTKVKMLTNDEANAWRAEHTITVSDVASCPAPYTKFAMLMGCVPAYLQKKLTDQGFTSPTPIQAQAWPILLAGRDLVGVAKTGSGKTLAFVVPALAHISVQEPLKPGDGPLCVVLAPTRELAQQIEQETIKVLPQNVRCGCIYGGSPKGPQLGMLRAGVHILVATPDEADRMLDMGFEPQVRAICGQIRPDRQTLMFSATWPKEIQQLAASFQRNWIRINVGSTELLANTDVTQHFILTNEHDKLTELKKLLEKRRNQRVLVFCKTKKTADYLEHQLKRIGVDAMAIHGDKEQRHREFILERFRRDPRLCLVATDVAARGLDIKELETVINFDFPMQVDDYVHRIGRTGRAGAKGEAITMITKREDQLTPQALKQLIGIITRAEQEVPDWMQEWCEQNGGNGNANYGVQRRNRNFMGGFAGRRNAPVMRMPGDHNNTGASFDPYGNNNNNSNNSSNATSNAPAKNYFGLGTRGNRNGTTSGNMSSQTNESNKSSSIQYKRFDTSSDDDDDDTSTNNNKSDNNAKNVSIAHISKRVRHA